MTWLLWWILILAGALVACGAFAAAEPFHHAGVIFPFERMHNHSSCIVELPNGDLLACWYRGVGPEKGDDVQVWGARKPRGAERWSEPFLLADTPGYPDNNPVLFVDAQQRLWLVWVTLLANRWETSILKRKLFTDYDQPGPPMWQWQDLIHVTPRADFEQQMNAGVEAYFERYAALAAAAPPAAVEHLKETRDLAGDRLYQRLGWMTRIHPQVLPSGRILIPLYSDNYDISLMALSDDGGVTWQASSVLMGVGNVQPSVVRRDDGTLVAMMRENGLQRRIRISESRDDGMTWAPVENMDLPNPGSSVEVIRLANGRWLLVYNPDPQGRHNLAVSISEDEGATWRWTRHLERGAGGSYPSVIQAAEGLIHVTYTHSGPEGEAIKHAAFNEEWVMEGDPRQ